jgi:hypothetical protein
MLRHAAIALLAAFVSCFCAAPHAVAQVQFDWPATNPSTCHVLKGKPLNTGSKVAFKPGATGKIILSCPIEMATITTTGFPFLYMTYRDSTGTGATGSVIAHLVSTDKNTGGRSKVKIFDSNLHASTAINREYGNDTINFGSRFTKTYTIEITLKRNTSTQKIEVYTFEYQLILG